MAMTINPAVSRVTYRRWTCHVGFFAVGVAAGALCTYLASRGLHAVLTLRSPVGWLVVALPLICLGVLRDLGVRAPLPYPSTRQVPEWLRRVLPPGLTALVYGGQLGTGFLTRYTFSTHAAFVALIATQSSLVVVAPAVAVFAAFKSIVVVAGLGGRSYPEFEQRLRRRHRMRGQKTLRFANAAVALAASIALAITL